MGRGQGTDSLEGAAVRRRSDTKVGSVNLETVKGLEVRVDLHRAIADGMNDSWEVDLLEAHGPYGPAGYLKAAYIPRETMENRYPSAFHWAVRESGSYFSLQELLPRADEPDRETLLELLSRSDGWQPAFVDERARRDGRSTNELRAEWQSRKATINSRHQDAYRSFREFHLDRPYIDYIRVYAGPEASERPYRAGRRHEPGEIDVSDYRGQGVGRALYEVAALWMATRGLKLHASGIQSSEAGAVWARFDEEGVTTTVPDGGREDGRGRRILDPDLLLQERPELVPVLQQLDQIVRS